jgi:hypothetical protein
MESVLAATATGNREPSISAKHESIDRNTVNDAEPNMGRKSWYGKIGEQHHQHGMCNETERSTVSDHV